MQLVDDSDKMRVEKQILKEEQEKLLILSEDLLKEA
jgi:hypothetical protein